MDRKCLVAYRPGVIVICNSNGHNCSSNSSSNRWNRTPCNSNINSNRKQSNSN